jgi:RNA ligase (TIGR02306 family)
MSTFEVPVLRIDDVYDHPNADRLSILRVRGYEAIANKHDDGSHRFLKGEPIIYVPEGAVVPERHLKERGYWNAEQGKGLLAGSQGNRVKAIKLRGVLSQGLVWKTAGVTAYDPDTAVLGFGSIDHDQPDLEPGQPISASGKFPVGADVSGFFGIVKYEEPIPTSMSGQVASVQEAKFDYDIENLKAFPDLFTEDDEVEVTEKLHGTFCRVSHVPRLAPQADLFGDGRVAIASKGLGARGLVFKNCEENFAGGNVYVRALDEVDIANFQAIAESLYPNRTVHLMGEVFGRGVQDLSYGEQAPAFRAFDVFVDGIGFLDSAAKQTFVQAVALLQVPILYRGAFDRQTIDKLVSGQTTLNGGGNIREGVVITAVGDQEKRDAGLGRTTRPILKHVSEAYLTRKGGTELQ